VRCCANLEGKKQAPRAMYWCCRGYLEKELAILKPNVIWTQGQRAHEAMSWVASAMPPASPGPTAPGHVELSLPWGLVAWIFTDHPTAYGAGKNKWGVTKRILRHAMLPCMDAR